MTEVSSTVGRVLSRDRLYVVMGRSVFEIVRPGETSEPSPVDAGAPVDGGTELADAGAAAAPDASAEQADAGEAAFLDAGVQDSGTLDAGGPVGHEPSLDGAAPDSGSAQPLADGGAHQADTGSSNGASHADDGCSVQPGTRSASLPAFALLFALSTFVRRRRASKKRRQPY